MPTAIAVFPADLAVLPPGSWVERRYQLVRYTLMPRGGHFAAAHEEPELLADDITTFFRQVKGEGVRSGQGAISRST